MHHGGPPGTKPDICLVEERNDGVRCRRAENGEWTICGFIESESARASRYSEPRSRHQRQLV
jgi:hypothetical protein